MSSSLFPLRHFPDDARCPGALIGLRAPIGDLLENY